MELIVGAGVFVLTLLVIHNRPRPIAAFLVLAMYVSRPALDVGGLTLRAEMVMGALCGFWLLRPRSAEPGGNRTRNTPRLAIALVLAWLLCGALTTWYMAPNVGSSMTVLVWCLLNFFTALWVCRTPESCEWILRYGIRTSAIVAAVALFAWSAATVGDGSWGVQPDPAYGGYAAYVTSIEANILGGLLCLWSLVATMKPRDVHLKFSTPALQLLGPLAIVTTHTRAALIAYVIGLLIIRLTGSGKWAWTVVTPIVLGVPLIFAYSGDAGLAKFDSLVDVESGTGALRYETNSLALEEWGAVSPTIGLGWNTFGQRHLDPSRPTERVPSYLGNLPLQILYDGGALAALLLSAAALSTMALLRRARRLRYAMGIGVPYFIFSVSTSSLWLLETWLFVGLAWAACAGRASTSLPETAELVAK